MKFNTIIEAKNYLSNINDVIIPKEYTYFLHCSAFELPEEAAKNKYNKSWTQLPLDTFTIIREMSFVERKVRIKDALDYGGLDKAMTSYAKHANSKPFQIRVIMPRLRLMEEEKIKLDMSSEDWALLQREYLGLGDMRHPKLKSGEIIEIFATSIYDEVTATQEDIFYGIRQQDLIKYAQLISEEFEILNEIEQAVIPTNRDDYYSWDDKTTFSLPKNKYNYRYSRKYIPDKNGNIQLFQYSDFEQEYLKDLAEKNEVNNKPKL